MQVMCIVESARGPQIIEHALTVPNLDLPSQSLPAAIVQRVKSLDIIDLKAHQNARPRILIGQDNWRLLETDEMRRVEGTGLVVSRSLLGWAVYGYLTEGADNLRSLRVHTICCSHDAGLTSEADKLAEFDALIKNYFELDNLGVSALTVKRHEEDRASRILRETTRKVGKSWETGLLWKRDILPKSDTRAAALKRLYALERKLDRDPETAALYYREMSRFIEKGYAIKLSKDQISDSPFARYISHFFVKNPNKPKKIRPVFDAAEKINGISLNDLLDTGPDLLESLLGVLLRFREHPFAVIADIKYMYLRIRVTEKDRMAQHYLYRGADRHRKPDTHLMTCLIFGSKSSPCSALYVKQRNAENFASVKPEAAKSIIRNSYMDDYLASRQSAAELHKLVNDVSFINGEANFEMHGWASNEAEIIKDVNKENKLAPVEKATLCDEEERVLGLFWDRENDCLRFNVGLTKIRNNLLIGEKKPTKREFCSIIMSVYDPLGILAPFTVNAKVIMQDVWRSAVGWDAMIRDEEFKPWKIWLENLLEISNCQIPRSFIPPEAEYTNSELHVFCDASLQAYAAVAYLRTLSRDGKVHLALVMAKTRVAPVKPTTVPRLELQAAVLGTRLAATICKELDVKIDNKVFWSDSSTVLQWIRVGPHSKLTYVRNRLGEIGEMTAVTQWRWVPTRMNPADDATRATETPMRSRDRWFVGPNFLRDAPQSWPKEKVLAASEIRHINELESKKEFIGTSTANIVTAPLTAKLLGWSGLIIVATRIRNYVNRWKRISLKRKGRALPLCARVKESLTDTRRVAAQFWYKEIQSACFAEDLEAVRRQHSLTKGSKLKYLRPFLDKDGILRADGHVKKTGEGQKIAFEPIILDARHFATKLLIGAYHRRYFHANNETVVNELRQEFYIIGLRTRLRSLAHNCLICRMRRAKPQNPPMANLPPCRVAYNLRPFTHCGIDYFGPMTIKIGRRREKRWGILFTCMTTRAIHLELANSLSASSAIMAIQRFACRRGFPRKIYSDNGTNFTKASKELRDAVSGIDIEKQQRFANEKGFEWNFNPSDAPHMGGAWERQIRSVKIALDHALKEQVPFEEVLLTLLIEIEHMVNSRSLTHVSVDPNDEEALTPNHFLIGTSSGHLRLERYEAEVLNPRKTFEMVQQYAQAFWKKWLREYLPTLLPRKKWNEVKLPLKIGDIVLIIDFQAPRNCWKKGKVIEVYPNSFDGIIRVAKVRSGKSELTRSVHKLVKICETE